MEDARVGARFAAGVVLMLSLVRVNCVRLSAVRCPVEAEMCRAFAVEREDAKS